MNGLSLGRVAGIPIRLHVSWVIILTLLVLTAVAQVGEVDPAATTLTRWTIAIVIGLAFLLSATAHEVAHAVMARRRGVATDELVVYFLGAAASTELTTTRPRDEIAVAAAGPLVSLAIGAALVALAQVAMLAGSEGVARVLVVIGVLDLVIGGINLLPAFPLDGGRIVRGIGWARTGDATKGLRIAAATGRAVGLLLAASSIAAVAFLTFQDGLMIALCGWFLISTARSVERGAGLDRLLEGLLVSDVMERDVATVSPTLTIDTFGGQVLDGTAAMALPVAVGGQLLGLIGARQIRQLRRDRWATTHAEDLMVSGPGLPIVSPDSTVRSALEDLTRARLDGLPVMVDGALTGVVTRRGVAEAVKARAEKAGTTFP